MEAPIPPKGEKKDIILSAAKMAVTFAVRPTQTETKTTPT